MDQIELFHKIWIRFIHIIINFYNMNKKQIFLKKSKDSFTLTYTYNLGVKEMVIVFCQNYFKASPYWCLYGYYMIFSI